MAKKQSCGRTNLRKSSCNNTKEDILFDSSPLVDSIVEIEGMDLLNLSTSSESDDESIDLEVDSLILTRRRLEKNTSNHQRRTKKHRLDTRRRKCSLKSQKNDNRADFFTDDDDDNTVDSLVLARKRLAAIHRPRRAMVKRSNITQSLENPIDKEEEIENGMNKVGQDSLSIPLQRKSDIKDSRIGLKNNHEAPTLLSNLIDSVELRSGINRAA